MYLKDLELAISERSATMLKQAFRDMVCGEEPLITISGKKVPLDEKQRLLARVCELLRTNDAVMPLETCGALDLPPGSTYAAGAAKTGFIEERSKAIDADPLHELYQHAFGKMHEFVGDAGADYDSLAGSLRSSTDYALTVFRDLLEATMCAQAGAYVGKASDTNPNLMERFGVKEHIEHAEHELGLLLDRLAVAKRNLAKVL